MSDKTVVSITTKDMETDPFIGIPEEIYEYRSLEKRDLINKVKEARQEIAELKKVPVNLKEVEDTVSKKDHFAIANELYALRQIIKTLKTTPLKEEKEPEDAQTKVNRKPKGRPKKQG